MLKKIVIFLMHRWYKNKNIMMSSFLKLDKGCINAVTIERGEYVSSEL